MTVTLPTPVISKHVFIEPMKTATTSVEFSFSNIMYRKIDAMGRPLSPTLANIFVGYNESKFFHKILKFTVYVRYLDDTFSFFHKETNFQEFLTWLNSLHPSLNSPMILKVIIVCLVWMYSTCYQI